MRWVSRFCLWVFLIAVAASCASAPTPTPTPSPTAAPTSTPPPTPTEAFVPASLALAASEQVSLRFVHAAPTAGTVDVYAEQLALATQLEVGSVTEGARITAGTYVLSVYSAGSSSDSEPLFRAPLTIEGGERYSVILTAAEGQLAVAAIPDDVSPLPTGQSRVLVINAASAAPTLDIGEPGQLPLIDDLIFGQSSPVLTFASGRYTLRAQAANGLNTENSFTLRESYSYVIVVTGDTELRWVQFESFVPGQAQAFFINALDPDVGAVDLYLDSQLLVSNLVFGSTTEQLSIPATSGTLRVVASGASSDSPALYTTSIGPSADDFIAYVLMGSEAFPQLMPVFDTTRTFNTQEASITFANVYSGQRRISSTNELDLTLEYAASPVTLTVAPGTREFAWRPTDDETLDTLFADTREFAAGVSYLYVITGRPDAPILVYERPVDPEQINEPLPEIAEIRWVNAIPDAQVIFALSGDAQTDSLSPSTGTEFMQVPQGDYLVTANTGEASSEAIVFSPRAYSRYSIYTFGTRADPRIAILTDEPLQPRPGSARLRFVHLGTSPDLTLSLGSASGLPNTDNPAFEATVIPDSPLSLPFGLDLIAQRTQANTASLPAQLDAGLYEFYVIDDNARGVVAFIPGITLNDGAVIELVAVKADDLSPLLIFELNYPSSVTSEATSGG